MFIAALGRIGVTELLVVLLIVLVIFGPKQLPKLSKSLGQTLKGFKEGMADDTPDAAQAAPAQNVEQAAPAQETAQPVYTQAAPVQEAAQPVYTAQAVDNTAAAPASALVDGQTGV
ncbi:MAG: twin-arginine translocase TatA/TatE family subunit [Lachnospiraceae bacterium]|nr:twin-arginine translocase TatA/TatE family subunit [Lachnospiraceae bacterium]